MSFVRTTFSLPIKLLLCQLRKNLQGFAVKGFENRLIKVSAYADDITVFIINKRDVEALTESLNVYEKA